MLDNKLGTLYVVATPIGNLQDITLRAIEILKKVDRIAAEDTRHSMSLLKHYSISKPSLSLHEFNEREQLDVLLQYLKQGESIALISDAGTPLISDPGFHLVKEAKEIGIEVIPIPGACAAIAALSAAGLPTDKFIFEGFLPAKSEARHHALEKLSAEERTLIFYEAPHRLLPTLQAMIEIFGDNRRAVIARELTKIHETILHAELKDLYEQFTTKAQTVRGEIVILVAGSKKQKSETNEISSERVLDILLAELPLKQAVFLASQITEVRKNILYEKALAKKLHR